MMRRYLQSTVLVVFVLLAAACGEENNPVVLETGTTRLFPSAPGLSGFQWQRFKDAETTIQAADWQFDFATFTYPEVTVDLAVPNLPDPTDRGGTVPCEFEASIQFRDPTAASNRSRCRLGVVIDSIEEAVPAALDTAFRMTVYRAKPELIQVGLNPDVGPTDYDGDGLLNANDPCPIIPLEGRAVDQDIADCSFIGANGNLVSDQDADGVADSLDNCVWNPNPGQANTTTHSTLSIEDGIGDACIEQSATVEVMGNPLIQIVRGPTDLIQPQNIATFSVVGFDFVSGLTCDWDAGTCQLAPEAVTFCITADITTAAFTSCP